ncbi:MAG: hypothetical protein UR46_C0014G0003 [Parcubacteria group bacterium GW2011_GWA1_33_6]|nr:MAG: hypothetical protein UR46_C0014G0003 [Parcubacteria group bacterium GW2011_GWA1_33_6]
MLLYLIIIIFVFSILMVPIIDSVSKKMQLLRSSANREQALQIAESGINYYQWHLAHYPNDYQDGSLQPGPYVHDYTDFDTQEIIGYFSLVITPPVAGSTIVTIQSTAWTTKNPAVTRTVTAKYGIPSLAKYSFLSNSIVWIGNNESVNGQFMSNNGIRFDGVGNAPIQSAKSTYTCPSGQGSPCPATKNGVWGSASQEVQNFWQFPVPAVDFSSLTSDLATMKSNAQSGGIYLPPSNTQGYSLVFNSNGTVSVYKVTSLKSNPTGWDTNGAAHNEYIDYNARTLQFTQLIPSNGIFYIEDKTWVEGTVNGRATVVAAKLPYNSSTAPTIYIPNNIVYAAKDGLHALGLIAQKNLVVTNRAPSNIEIDGALISQNGGVQFYYYPNNIKNTITTYGSIMTLNQWTWTWVNGAGTVVSGYPTTISNYDSNLLYGPPPNFPFSSSNYELLSWISN